MNNLSQAMKCFLDAVTNPFGAHTPCGVPDAYNHDTLVLQDWSDVQSVGTNSPALTDVIGVMFTLVLGNNDLTAIATADKTYTILKADISSIGQLQFDNTGGGIPTVLTPNYQTINGAVVGVDPNNSLVDSFRIYGAGIKVRPTIEMITDSSTFAVASYYGGLMTPHSIFKSQNLGENFFDVVRQAEFMLEYPNYKGVSVRLDPFQHPLLLDMRTLDNWLEQINYDTSMIAFPTIVVRFNQDVTVPNPFVTTVLPIRFEAQIWMEGRLVQPTPIFSSRSPMDLQFLPITQSIAYSPQLYPITSEANSFKSFFNMNNLRGVGRAVGTALTLSSKLMPLEYQAMATVAGNTLSTISRRKRRPQRRAVAPIVVARRGRSRRPRSRSMKPIVAIRAQPQRRGRSRRRSRGYRVY